MYRCVPLWPARRPGRSVLDFAEFSSLVREREVAIHSEDALRARFNALDMMGCGRVSISAYIVWAIKDALARSASRVIDLFAMWDDDDSGSIDKKEFRKAVRAFGFDATDEEVGVAAAPAQSHTRSLTHLCACARALASRDTNATPPCVHASLVHWDDGGSTLF